MKHWPLGGSTAARTLACEGWRYWSSKMPERTVSDAAHEGTAMHTLFERGVIDKDYLVIDQTGETVEGVEITDTHVDKVLDALDAYDTLCANYGLSDMQAETEYEYDANIGGTADLIAQSNDTFFVGDLKTGDGEMVYAKDNAQLMFYAWLAMLDNPKIAGIKKAVLFIIQPSERRDNILDVWETSFAGIEAFARRFLTRADNVINATKDGPTTTGDHCKWCAAQSICPAQTQAVETAMRFDPESVQLKQIVQSVRVLEDVERWTKAMRKVVYEQLNQGVRIPGWKLVAKRAIRQWDGEMDTTFASGKLTKSEYLETKLRSPAQIEKLCKQRGLPFDPYNARVIKVSSGTTAVQDSDPRTAATPVAHLAQRLKALKRK